MKRKIIVPTVMITVVIRMISIIVMMRRRRRKRSINDLKKNINDYMTEVQAAMVCTRVMHKKNT